MRVLLLCAKHLFVAAIVAGWRRGSGLPRASEYSANRHFARQTVMHAKQEIQNLRQPAPMLDRAGCTSAQSRIASTPVT